MATDTTWTRDYAAIKDQPSKRLRRIEGPVRGHGCIVNSIAVSGPSSNSRL
jgi:hypothetical protein